MCVYFALCIRTWCRFTKAVSPIPKTVISEIQGTYKSVFKCFIIVLNHENKLIKCESVTILSAASLMENFTQVGNKE